MVRKQLWIAACVVAACGEAPTLLPRPETAVTTRGNTPLPDPALNDPKPLSAPPSSDFSGTIAELWALPLKSSGLLVRIPVAVVTSNAGNQQTMYVNDLQLSDASGIQVERCAKDDPSCKSAAPPRGSQVSISGTLFTNRDGGGTIGKATVTQIPDAPLLSSQARLVYTRNVQKGKLTGNEAVRATLVHIVDEMGNDARFVVSNLTPEDDRNGNYPEELDAQCGAGKTLPDGVSCCPAGIGPKYYSFEVTDAATGEIVSIGSGNYRDIDFNSFPCGPRDAAGSLKLGDEFTSLGGIFDVAFGKATVSPADFNDYVLVRH